MAKLLLSSFQWSFESPFANSGATWRGRHGLGVDLVCPHSGLRGSGEASPLPGYSRDCIADCRRWLEKCDPAQLDELASGRSALALQESLRRLPGSSPPAARFALEVAAFDLLGQRLHKPVWQLLRSLSTLGADAPITSGIPLFPVLSTHDVHEALQQAERAWAVDIRGFKLKVGPRNVTDLQLDLLRELTRSYGPLATIRLDANQSFDPDQWQAIEHELVAFGPLLLEEPWALDRQPWPQETPLSLALDESLQARSLVWVRQALLSTPRLRAVVIKPTALGGLLHCQQLAELAQSLGKKAIVSHTLEGPTGWKAAAHLAWALGQPTALGLWPLPHQGEVLEQFVRNGQLVMPEVSGVDTPL